MKNPSKYFWLLMTVPFLLLTSCKDDDDPKPSNEFEILTDYLVDNDLDVAKVTSDWIVGVPAEADLSTFLSSYALFDLRQPAAFQAGHMEGAINTTLDNILTEAASVSKPILVACYTGQSAGHAVMALRLSGYPDAKVLKFGMSQWNSATQDPWNDNTKDIAIGHTNWTMDPVASSVTFDAPPLNTGETDGAAILAARVQAMISGGFKGVDAINVLDNPNDYFINNYWSEGDVSKYGHIQGAYRIQPLTLTNNEIYYLDPNSKVVTYCWTGQTSSMLTAYLNVLGYDAVSLKFGANGMIYSNLEGHKYSPPLVDLPVVTE